MATKRSSKKKVDASITAVADASGPGDSSEAVRQVVEVVSEGELSTAAEDTIETIKKDAKEIEEAAEQLEEEVLKGSEGEQVASKGAEPFRDENDVSLPPAEGQEDRKKEMVEELFQKKPQVGPDISMHRAENALPLWLWAVIVLGIALLVGSVLVGTFRGGLKVSLFAKPTPTPTPASIPTPAPVAVNREDLTLEVTNGGGTPGAASKMKKFLEGKGYNVGALGNADEYTFEKTEIHVKTSKAGALSLLEEDLKDSYTLGSGSADLSEDSSYDGRVIVGKE